MLPPNQVLAVASLAMVDGAPGSDSSVAHVFVAPNSEPQ